MGSKRGNDQRSTGRERRWCHGPERQDKNEDGALADRDLLKPDVDEVPTTPLEEGGGDESALTASGPGDDGGDNDGKHADHEGEDNDLRAEYADNEEEDSNAMWDLPSTSSPRWTVEWIRSTETISTKTTAPTLIGI